MATRGAWSFDRLCKNLHDLGWQNSHRSIACRRLRICKPLRPRAPQPPGKRRYATQASSFLRYRVYRPLGSPTARRLRHRQQPRAPDRRLGAQTRRPLLRRLRKMYQRAKHLSKGFSATRRHRGNSGRIRRPARPPQRREGPSMNIDLPIRKAILNRHTYEAPAEGREGKIRLDFNENTSGCSEAVRRALSKITAQKLAMYPEYAQPTKRIARHFGVRPEELLLANGGDDALRVFFDTFVEPASTVLICEPTFPMYRYYAEIAGAEVATLRYDTSMKFPLVDALAAVRQKPRVLFLANPNNPTGTLIPQPEIRAILQAATGTAVVIDEAYAEFSGATVLPWIRTFPNLFVVRTFSKAAGLASLRLGAVIGHADSLQLLRRAMPPYPVNLAALVAAEAALSDRTAIKKYVATTLRVRKDFAAKLSKLGVTTYPSAGNFILADFGPHGPALFAKLARARILVRERSKEIAPGFVRITIGTKSEMASVLIPIHKFTKKAGIEKSS